MDDDWIVEKLEPMIAPQRLNRIEDVIAHRTYGVTVVLETLYDMGNMAAIMRTCEAFGVQRVNMLSLGAIKSERKITQGAHKWLDVHRFNDPSACVNELRSEGYQIVATHFDDDAVSIDEIDFTRKTAVIFGNERSGVSPELVKMADHCMVIPMYGFVQSFNVSVAASMTLQHAIRARREAFGGVGDLSEGEKQQLRSRFFRRSVRYSDLILDRVLSRQR